MSEENANDERGAFITASAKWFPIVHFDEWDEDCKNNFGHLRWIKMMHDHKMSKLIEDLKIADRITELEKRLDSIEKKPLENVSKRITLGK